MEENSETPRVHATHYALVGLVLVVSIGVGLYASSLIFENGKNAHRANAKIMRSSAVGTDITTASSGVRSYIIGTADSRWGRDEEAGYAYPYPPYDVIDLSNEVNVGLDGQFVRALCAANSAMSCELVPVDYSECVKSNADGENIFGDLLGKGAIDACSTWFQTTRRAQMGGTWTLPLASSARLERGVLLRRPGAPGLPDTNDAINSLGIIPAVAGWAADRACLQEHYPDAVGLADKMEFVGADAIYNGLADGTYDYAWVLEKANIEWPPAGTEYAHGYLSLHNLGTPCGGASALIMNENSKTRTHKSSQLREDANCGIALLAAKSEIESGAHDFTKGTASNDSVSGTDFKDTACGNDVPGSGDASDICARDSEIPLPTLKCLADNGYSPPGL